MSAAAMADPVILDDLDEQIVRCLQLRPRAAFSRIGEVLAVSEQTVARRYRRLQRAGRAAGDRRGGPAGAGAERLAAAHPEPSGRDAGSRPGAEPAPRRGLGERQRRWLGAGLRRALAQPARTRTAAGRPAAAHRERARRCRPRSCCAVSPAAARRTGSACGDALTPAPAAADGHRPGAAQSARPRPPCSTRATTRCSRSSAATGGRRSARSRVRPGRPKAASRGGWRRCSTPAWCISTSIWPARHSASRPSAYLWLTVAPAQLEATVQRARQARRGAVRRCVERTVQCRRVGDLPRSGRAVSAT